jgi:hypothetical protein
VQLKKEITKTCSLDLRIGSAPTYHTTLQDGAKVELTNNSELHVCDPVGNTMLKTKLRQDEEILIDGTKLETQPKPKKADAE